MTRPQPPEPPPGHLLSPAEAKPGRADPNHQQRSLAGLFLALLSLSGFLGLSNVQRGGYVVTVALVAGLAAIWFAGTAITRARRSGTAGPRGSVTALIIGSVGVLLSSLLLTGLALFGPQARSFSQCIAGANTLTAQQACRNQFLRSLRGAAR
jgi:hypothetical protein